MEIFILENSKMEKPMDLGHINGLMERNMKVNGSMEFDRVKEYGKEPIIIYMLVIGNKIEQKDLVLILGLMEINMMGNGFNLKNKEKVLIYLPMVIPIMDNMIKEFQMEQEFMYGQMEVYMKDSLKMDLSMEKEFGKKLKIINKQLNIKEIILWIKNKDMVNSNGNQVIFIKVVIWKMKEKVMESYILQMELFIKVIGKKEFKMGLG